MDIKTAFLVFGISLACLAVIVSFIGLRKKDFPSRGAFIILFSLFVFCVAGTTYFAVELSVEEAHEREKGGEAAGEEETEAAAVRIIQPADAA